MLQSYAFILTFSYISFIKIEKKYYFSLASINLPQIHYDLLKRQYLSNKNYIHLTILPERFLLESNLYQLAFVHNKIHTNRKE